MLQLPVMGGDDYGRVGGLKGLGELVDQSDRQVVGRLVEKQHLRAARQRERQVQPPLLTH